MLAAPHARHLSRTLVGQLAQLTDAQIELRLQQLRKQGESELIAEGFGSDQLDSESFVDLRYLGQGYTLTTPWRGGTQTEADFHAAHRHRYGHLLDSAVELVTLRVTVKGPQPHLELAGAAEQTVPRVKPRRVKLAGVSESVPLYGRDDLLVGETLSGPLLITEPVATTYITAGWRCEVGVGGNLLVARQ